MPPYMGNKGHYTASLGELCQASWRRRKKSGDLRFAMSDILYDEKANYRAKTIITGVDQQGTGWRTFRRYRVDQEANHLTAEGSRAA